MQEAFSDEGTKGISEQKRKYQSLQHQLQQIEARSLWFASCNGLITKDYARSESEILD